MAWSETMYTIQHFYNAFDVDKRLHQLENKTPLVLKKDLNGNPEGVNINNLTPGTLWFIEEDE